MTDTTRRQPAWAFPGFSSPNTTAVPDEFFDDLMHRLTESELRCLLYIIRRTFGFKKQTDDISLKQLVDGITTHDGRVLDHGTGLSKQGAANGVKGLIKKGIVTALRNRSRAKGDEPTTYQLRFRSDPLSTTLTGGGQRNGHPRVSHVDTQHTVLQQTDLSSSIENGDRGEERKVPRGNQPPAGRRSGSHGFTSVGTTIGQYQQAPLPSAEDRQVIQSYVRDVAHAFGDRAILRASTTRALHLMHRSGASREVMISRMFEAAAKTRASSTGQTPIRNKMAFFFSVLADLLGLQSGEMLTGMDGQPKTGGRLPGTARTQHARTAPAHAERAEYRFSTSTNPARPLARAVDGHVDNEPLD